MLTGPAEGVGAGVGGMGQDVVHRVVGRVDPDDLGGRRDVAILAQRQPQSLVTQPQPYRPHRTTGGELLEDRGEDAADGLVGVFEDLSVGLTPHQPDRQPDAQFAASGLGADAAVEAGPQNVQFGLRHGPFHAEQQAVVEQSRMVDAVCVGDQGVGHPGQVQQPIPVGVVASQPRHLQRQHDSHLPEPDLGGQLGEPGPARGAGTADAEVVIDHPHRAARPAQRLGPCGQIVLAGGRFLVAVDLGEAGLADIDDRGSPQVPGGDLRLIHRRPRFPSARPRSPSRSRWPAT